MTEKIVVAGTGTDVGKTVFAAALTVALDGYYWKPIQCGLEGVPDSEAVRRLGGLPANRIMPEAYIFKTPASPHFAAEVEGTAVDLSRLTPPHVAGPLVIEGAGGLAVPLTRSLLQIDLYAHWKYPVVLCALTQLGTINHSLLSIEALKRRAIPILGIAFIGNENRDSEDTICSMGGVKRLGRLPRLDKLDSVCLLDAFAENFNVGDILGLGARGP